MKKFIFGFAALIIVGVVAVSFPKQRNKDKQKVDVTEDSVDADYWFYTEELSNKDIYFKADTSLPDNPVISDMVDVANGYAILRAAYCDAELWFRFGVVVNDTIGLLKTNVIQDRGTRAAAEQYVKTLVGILPRDIVLWHQADSVLWSHLRSACKSFDDKLTSRFAFSHYGQITKKDVERYMDIKQFIPNYDSVHNLRKIQSEVSDRYLKKMLYETSSFDKECLYTIEIAHQNRHEKPHPAIPLLEHLMMKGKYSRYLPVMWRTWRALKQVAESPSSDGRILNLEYNQMRNRCLNTILRQILKNPKDICVIHDFCLLATYDNITRYCEYLFGNSAPLEQMVLFPEIFEDTDEGNEDGGETDNQ